MAGAVGCAAIGGAPAVAGTANGRAHRPQAQPPPIPGARFVHGIAPLRAASRNHPAILGFNWDGGGGHFVVCVGPTRTDPTLFVILDPDGGLQYMSSEDAVGDQLRYNPSYGASGRIDPVAYIVT